MNKLFLVLIFMAFAVNLGFSQSFNNYHFSYPDDIYPSISADQVKCEKIEYIRIYKDDIQNYPLFYPEEPTNLNSNLIDVILDAIHTQGVTAYKAMAMDDGEEFDVILKEEEIHENMGATTERVSTGTDYVLIQNPYDSKEITSFLIKEAWLYDYNDNLIGKRVIGICPVRQYYREHDIEQIEPLYRKVFWIYFPEVYELLKNTNAIGSNSEDLGSFADFIINNKYVGNYMSSEDYWLTFLDEIDEYTEQEINYFNTLYSNNPISIPSDNSNIDYYSVLDYSKPNDTIVAAKAVYKRVWNDPENFEIFNPQHPSRGYMSLIDLLLDGIHTLGFTAYKSGAADAGQEYSIILTEDEIHSAMGAYSEFIWNGIDTTIIHNPYNSSEITSYLFHEVEFYNSKGEVVQTRIIGICPVREYYRQTDFDEPAYRKVFWIYYDEIKDLLAQQNVAKLSCDTTKNYNQYFFNKDYTGYNMTDSLGSRSNYYFDSLYFDNAYNHNYYNLYSDDLVANNLSNQTNVIKVKNVKYSIKPQKYKSAKIVYTEFSANIDSLLFLPLIPQMGFQSFSDLIIDALLIKGKPAFKNDDFSEQLTNSEILTALGEYTEHVINSNGDTVSFTVPYHSIDIVKYQLKELWLYDKQGNVVEKRILAICPIREYYSQTDYDQLNPKYVKTFWINFKDFKNIFEENYVTQYNFSLPETFNNYFIKQKYTANVVNEIDIKKKDAKNILKR